jgi:hypothetical protein
MTNRTVTKEPDGTTVVTTTFAVDRLEISADGKEWTTLYDKDELEYTGWYTYRKDGELVIEQVKYKIRTTDRYEALKVLTVRVNWLLGNYDHDFIRTDWRWLPSVWEPGDPNPFERYL